MNEKTLPCPEEKLREIAEQYPTPFHIYSEEAILANVRTVKDAFSWNPGFRNYFAVKATPNPFLLKLLAKEGFGADCSSSPELSLAEICGLTGEDIMFTSNDTPASEYQKALAMGAIINLDDLSHVEFLEKNAGIPDLICFRYNPGPLKEGNAIIGHPEDAKYGATRDQLLEGYRIMRDKGVKRFGIHTMVASNELDYQYFIETAQILFELVTDISKTLDIRFEFVNIGGGIGIPYRPEESPVNLQKVGQGIHDLYDRIIIDNGLPPLNLYMECGRMITGPYGWLVSKVLHKKETYKTFVGLDACMTNLMRPALYGAYHHITVVGKDNTDRVVCDVTGSLCENNDKFAIDRELPMMEPGDLVVIHDAGAHGHAMGFNYNGKLRSAELLLRKDGSVREIRRAETQEDLFATLDLGAVEDFE